MCSEALKLAAIFQIISVFRNWKKPNCTEFKIPKKNLLQWFWCWLTLIAKIKCSSFQQLTDIKRWHKVTENKTYHLRPFYILPTFSWICQWYCRYNHKHTRHHIKCCITFCFATNAFFSSYIFEKKIYIKARSCLLKLNQITCNQQMSLKYNNANKTKK